MSALVAERVGVRAGARALLSDVEATFQPGALTVVVGENGAGKSTLLDALAGLRRLHEGRVLLGDDVVHALPPRARARRIASLGQHDASGFEVTVEARIGQGLVPRRGPSALLDAPTRARVRAVAEELGVDGLLERDLASLSSGERRRAHLARALVDDEAEVVLLDEPHAGVDVRHQALVSAAIRRRRERGAAVVVTVHDLAVAAQMADFVVGLRQGRVVVAGPPDEALSPAGLEAVYGVKGARIVREGDAVGVLLPRA